MIDIVSGIDTYLHTQWEAREHREIAHGKTWRASLLGSCLLRQYLELHAKVPAILEPDNLSLRKFEIGKLWGTAIADWVTGAGYHVTGLEVPVSSDLWDIGGHIDIECEEVIIEVKSVQSDWFWYRKDEPEIGFENMVQAATYSLIRNKPALVLSISKDDLTMRQDHVTDVHRHEAKRRLSLLGVASDTGVALPACTCQDPKGEFHGSQWKWCPYYEGDPAKRRAKSAKPNGPCCRLPKERAA